MIRMKRKLIIALILSALFNTANAGLYKTEEELRIERIQEESEEKRLRSLLFESREITSKITPCSNSSIVDAIKISSARYSHGLFGMIAQQYYRLYLCSDGSVSYKVDH